jgi:type I restriction-modification system DNA methylase subunit
LTGEKSGGLLKKEIKELKAKSFSTAVETEETETVAEKLDVESRKIDENLREVEGVIDKASALSSEKKTELKEALKFLRHENTTKQQHRQSSTAKKYVGKIKEYAQDATLTAGAIDLVVRIAEFLLSVF